MKCVLCGVSQFSTVFTSRTSWRVEKCVACGLVQAVPMPTRADIRRLYYHENFEYAEPYITQLSVHRAYFRKQMNEILRRTGRTKHLKLLDIGCAMGVFLEEAKKKGIRAFGIDISSDAASYCRKKKLAVYQGTILSVGDRFPKHTFDIITAFEVIEHERDPLRMMRRIHALLTPGGFAVLTTPNHESLWRKIMGKWWIGYQHPEHVTVWDRTSLGFLMQKVGFRNVEIRSDVPRPFPLSFAVTRSADYFPWLAWFLRPIGRFLDRFPVKNPLNPWNGLIVFARK